MTAAATKRVLIAFALPIMCLSFLSNVLLTRGCANAVPCIAHLVVMDLWQIVRRAQVKGMHVQPADRAQKRIGSNHPVSLCQNLPGPCACQILLRIEDVDRCALPPRRLAS